MGWSTQMTTKSCRFLSTEWVNSKLKQVLVGTITLKDGKLFFKAEKGNEIEMKNIMSMRGNIDPTKWFNALPKAFDGIALRAQMSNGKKKT